MNIQDPIFTDKPVGLVFRDATDACHVDQELSNALAEIRLSMSMTQKKMAEKMGMPQGNVSRLESGISSPTIGMLQRAARALDVSLQIRIGNQIININ